MTATVGREVFTPIKFHTFEVGPFSVRTSVRERETGAQAYERARATAQAMFDAEYTAKLTGHLRRVRQAAEQTRAAVGQG